MPEGLLVGKNLLIDSWFGFCLARFSFAPFAAAAAINSPLEQVTFAKQGLRKAFVMPVIIGMVGEGAVLFHAGTEIGNVDGDRF